MIRFSFGIPAYKAQFLKECIASILNQTYKNLELIIVNDASPEDIQNIVQKFTDTRIKYYVNENNIGAENVTDNWNKCLSYAQGDYFVLMGDDDVIEPDYLEEFDKLIKQYPGLDIYHCRTKIINENSEFVMLTEARPSYESVYSAIWHRMNGRLQYISDFLYQTNTLKNNGGFYKLPLAWASDDISSYIASSTYGIANTNKPIFMYRQNRYTISSTGNIGLKMNALQLNEKWIASFLSENKATTEEDRLLSLMIYNKASDYFRKKQINTIIYNFTKNPIEGFIWYLRNKSRYHLSFTTIFYVVAGIIKKRITTDSRFIGNLP